MQAATSSRPAVRHEMRRGHHVGHGFFAVATDAITSVMSASSDAIDGEMGRFASIVTSLRGGVIHSDGKTIESF
jgi:hypothetical protein